MLKGAASKSKGQLGLVYLLHIYYLPVILCKKTIGGVSIYSQENTGKGPFWERFSFLHKKGWHGTFFEFSIVTIFCGH